MLCPAQDATAWNALAALTAGSLAANGIRTAARALPAFEQDGRRIKINPLGAMGAAESGAYMTNYDLPRHPLGRTGYPSLAAPCTTRVTPAKTRARVAGATLTKRMRHSF